MSRAAEPYLDWFDDELNGCWVRAVTQARTWREGGADLSLWMAHLEDAGWHDLCPMPSGDASSPRAVGANTIVCAEWLCHLEALAAVNAGVAAALCAQFASRLALHACQPSDSCKAALRELAGQWMPWPLFHDIDEQLWPVMNAQGHLQGQVDMLLSGTWARWALLPAQGRDGGLQLVLVDLQHPAVIRGMQLNTLGLLNSGLNDVEFGGVPCEVLARDGRQVFTYVMTQLAPAAMAMLCGLSRAACEAAEQHLLNLSEGIGAHRGDRGPATHATHLVTNMRERLSAMQGLMIAAVARARRDQPLGTFSQKTSEASSLALGSQSMDQVLHAGDLAASLATDGLRVLSMETPGGVPANFRAAFYAQAQRVCDARQLIGLLGGVAWRRHGAKEVL